MPDHWSAEQITNLNGHRVIVTGANAGIGFETAKALAAKGAVVTLACRNLAKADDARDRILRAHRGAAVEVGQLDLADLDAVAEFAEAVRASHPHLDLLINNAGVMTPPRGTTAQGFELQFGTNHLGHFALTGRLLDLLEAAASPRVVTVSSIAHHGGDIDFDNFRLERRYRAWREYSQSKLANLSFTLELERRLRAAGRKTLSMAAHPGISSTELDRHFPKFMRRAGAWFLMEAWQGALPTLYAATEDLRGGSYIGPDGFREIRGWPAPAKNSRKARDTDLGRRLFDTSEALTGVQYPI